MGLTLRKNKATSLTKEELDENFVYLENLIKNSKEVHMSYDEHQDLVRYRGLVEQGMAITITIEDNSKSGKSVEMKATDPVPSTIISKLNESIAVNRALLRVIEDRNNRIEDTINHGKLPFKRPHLLSHIFDWFKNSRWKPLD